MIVVTRHPALVDLLREEGVITGDALVIPHATPEDVRGQHVVGVLPLHLAALAASVTVPVLELRPEDRGRELTLPELRERYRGVERYVVLDGDRLRMLEDTWIYAQIMPLDEGGRWALVESLEGLLQGVSHG